MTLPPPTRSVQWSSAVQNISAIAAITHLADARLLSGTWAGVLIGAIVGIIALPALKGKLPGAVS